MHLIGSITASMDAAAARAEWMRLMDVHPGLSRGTGGSGINPFTRKAMTFAPASDAATVNKGHRRIGVIHWAMDGSAGLIVWSEPGSEAVMGEMALDIATRLKWQFEPRSAESASNAS